MKVLKYTGLLLLLLTVLSGCALGGEDKKEQKTEYRIYYLSPTEEELVEDDFIPGERVTSSMVMEMKETLEEPVKDDKFIKLIPENVKILSCEFDGREVSLDFSKEYYEMKNTREILVRTGVVKSFVQIPGVLTVSFLVEGKPLVDSGNTEIGPMDKESFVESGGENPNSYVYADINLYFANEKGDKLVKIKNGGGYYSINVPLEKKVVEQLIKGPPEGSKAKPTIAPDTKILSISTVEGICYVNLDKTFMMQGMDVHQEVPIYSIVNSLMDACKVQGVQIAVEGDTKVTFRESMSLDKLYHADYTLVEGSENE